MLMKTVLTKSFRWWRSLWKNDSFRNPNFFVACLTVAPSPSDIIVPLSLFKNPYLIAMIMKQAYPEIQKIMEIGNRLKFARFMNY